MSQSATITFPPGANEYERSIEWSNLGEISDSDFGFSDLAEKLDRARYNVRILLFDKNGKICVIRSAKYGYIQIPGGGIEGDESLEQALRRETREETGFEIREIEPLGYFCENRESVYNIHNWKKSITFAFVAKIEKEVGTDYTDDEIAEGFEPSWIKVDEALSIFSNAEGKIASYSGNFSNRRDLILIKSLIRREVGNE
mgnify:CR=1 FL=1